MSGDPGLPNDHSTGSIDASVFRDACAAAFAAIADPVLLLDSCSRIVDANSRALLTLNTTGALLQGRSLSSVIPAGGVAELIARLDPGESFTLRAQLTEPIASANSIELRITRIALAGPPLFVCVLHSLSAEAFALYNQLAILLDQAPWICFQKTVSGRYEYINRRYSDVYGIEQQRIVGCTDADLFPPAVVQPLRAHDQIVAESGRVLVTEERVPQADGEHVFLVYKFPLRDVSGQITSIGGIAADVTEQRRLETALRQAALTEQQRLSQQLHDADGQELGASSLLTAKLLRESGGENPELTDALHELQRSIARAGQSCRDVARGLTPIEDPVTGLQEALRELVTRVCRSTGVPNVSFSNESTSPLQIPLEASNHLYRIAQEALSNAVRHSAATQVVVGLYIDQDTVRLTITDDGRGPHGDNSAGMGLQTMQSRADAIGASLALRASEAGGAVLVCERENRPVPRIGAALSSIGTSRASFDAEWRPAGS